MKYQIEHTYSAFAVVKSGEDTCESRPLPHSFGPESEAQCSMTIPPSGREKRS